MHSTTQPLDILLLSQVCFNNAQTVVDHVFAFREFSRHRIFVIPWMGPLPPELDLNRFDAIVIHYTVVPFLESYIPPADRARLKAFQGLKVGFRQDEYHKINRYHFEMRDLGFRLFYTCIPEPHIKTVYPKFLLPGVTFKNTLTGYVPRSFLSFPRRPIAERSIHIGYRARSCPFWYGDLAREKSTIAELFFRACGAAGLVCDVNAEEKRRLYGADWARFISECKGMLGTESGSSVLDFNEELEEQWVELTRSPITSEGITSITYEEYRNRYLLAKQRIGLMNQISPRAFEAAAMGTVLVLYEGAYSGILEAGRHYIPVKKNRSNMPEVLRLLKDNAFLQDMADRSYKEIACNPNYSYESFIRQFDSDVDQFLPEKRKIGRSYLNDEFALLLERHGYVNVADMIEAERQGQKGSVRPFEISCLPYTHGLKRPR